MTELKRVRAPSAALTGLALRTAAKARVAQWNARARKPQGVQHEILLKHVRTAANTEFGRAHGFSKIKSYDDFKKQVPVRTYADFEVDLERMRKGARDVLWPGLIPYYGQSSGSSSTVAQHKFLPISLEQIGYQRKAAFDLLARYLTLTDDKEFVGGYSLGLFPPSVLKEESPGVNVGSNPGIMLRHLPGPVRAMSIPQPPIRDIVDYNEKLNAIAREYMFHDVRAISGTTCWFSIFFDRLLEASKERGIGAKYVAEIWPKLRVLFGGGVHAEPYRKVIRERIGRDVVLMDNYNATEGGIFAATDRLGEPGMIMVPDRGVFYEYVPRREAGKPGARRLALWEVEPGEDYAVVLTTSSGLFAYSIGDFVRFTSIFPHRMEFAGRASGMLSLTQELTSYLEIERAVSAAVEEIPCTIVDYTASSEVGIDQTGKGRYVFFIEFEQGHEPRSGASGAGLGELEAAIDRQVCRQNRVYREHRLGDVAILPPRIIKLPKGTTNRFMNELGYSSVQNKFPRIIDERRRDMMLALVRRGEVE